MNTISYATYHKTTQQHHRCYAAAAAAAVITHIPAARRPPAAPAATTRALATWTALRTDRGSPGKLALLVLLPGKRDLLFFFLFRYAKNSIFNLDNLT